MSRTEKRRDGQTDGQTDQWRELGNCITKEQGSNLFASEGPAPLGVQLVADEEELWMTFRFLVSVGDWPAMTLASTEEKRKPGCVNSGISRVMIAVGPWE